MDIPTVLTSAVVATISSAFIAGYFNIHMKQIEYKNEYYSLILKRRISAYEQLEALIVAIKTSVIDEDGKPYHLLFSKDDDWHSAYSILVNINSNSLWLSAEAFSKTQELNYLMFRLNTEGGAIEFGKLNYQTIAEIRVSLEHIISNDLVNLYHIKRFLKQKGNVESMYREIKINS